VGKIVIIVLDLHVEPDEKFMLCIRYIVTASCCVEAVIARLATASI
jgi:hypothetical protein